VRLIALATDTTSETVTKRTIALVPATSMWSNPSTVPLATSSRAPVNKLPRSISDAYINLNAKAAADPDVVPDVPVDVDSMMPLYLSEELSPRFSRAKATKGWNLAREAEREEKEKFAARAVQQWREGGRDAGLESTLAKVGLGGVTVRGRTSKEVREAAESDYQNALFERSRIARMAKRAGGKFDIVNDQWKVEIDPAKLKRMQKKAERAKRKETFLRLNKLPV
jgi:large subunit ribosomal protein L24